MMVFLIEKFNNLKLKWESFNQKQRDQIFSKVLRILVYSPNIWVYYHSSEWDICLKTDASPNVSCLTLISDHDDPPYVGEHYSICVPKSHVISHLQGSSDSPFPMECKPLSTAQSHTTFMARHSPTSPRSLWALLNWTTYQIHFIFPLKGTTSGYIQSNRIFLNI